MKIVRNFETVFWLYFEVLNKELSWYWGSRSDLCILSLVLKKHLRISGKIDAEFRPGRLGKEHISKKAAYWNGQQETVK